jgi:hypothetical protein
MKRSLNILALIVSASFCFQASAATITVTSTADSGAGSLRQAIADANANPGFDTITFNVTGTILLASALPDLSDDVAISGPGANALTVKRDPAASSFGIFTVNSGKTVTISGLTITNGATNNKGGGILNDHAMLTISNCTVSGNSAPLGVGSGIYNNGNFGSASLTVVNSTFSGNSAIGGGGGIYNECNGGGSASLQIRNSTLSGNNAGNASGGGIFSDGRGGGSASLTVVNSTFSGNSAIDGGAIVNTAVGGDGDRRHRQHHPE